MLFPVFHELVGDRAWRELGEQFEDEEKKKLGDQGFGGAVGQVAKAGGAVRRLADLEQFTPG